VVHPPPVEDLGQVGDLAAFHHAPPEVGILVVDVVGAVAADLPQDADGS